MGKRILVVDDDAMNLRMAAHALERNSYEVILASSGAEGLAKLEENQENQGNQVDLVLLDIEMPEMNGIETFRLIVSNYVNIPVIFLTASGDKKDVMDAIKLGAVGYIKKPFIPKDLLERVSKALG